MCGPRAPSSSLCQRIKCPQLCGPRAPSSTLCQRIKYVGLAHQVPRVILKLACMCNRLLLRHTYISLIQHLNKPLSCKHSSFSYTYFAAHHVRSTRQLGTCEVRVGSVHVITFWYYLHEARIQYWYLLFEYRVAVAREGAVKMFGFTKQLSQTKYPYLLAFQV